MIGVRRVRLPEAVDREPRMNRILIVRMSALGDIVHALPVLAALREAYPRAEIDWLADRAYAGVLDLVDGPQPLHHRPAGLAAGDAIVMRGRRYDVALDLQGLIKSAAMARLSGARRVIGFESGALRERAAAWFYTETAPVPHGAHIIQKNLSVLPVLGRPAVARRFPFVVPDHRPWPTAVVADAATRGPGALRADQSRARRGRTSAGRRSGSARSRGAFATTRAAVIRAVGRGEAALADAVVAQSTRRGHARARDDAWRSAGAVVARGADGVGRHRADAPRRRDGDADRRPVRSDVARTQRSVGSGRRCRLAGDAVRLSSQAAVSARRVAQRVRGCASTTSPSTRWWRRSIGCVARAGRRPARLDVGRRMTWRSGSRAGECRSGFLLGAVVLWLAQPTLGVAAVGAVVAAIGEALAHLGGRPSREEPRGDAVGAVSASRGIRSISDRRSSAWALRSRAASCVVALLVALYLRATISGGDPGGGGAPAREVRRRSTMPIVQRDGAADGAPLQPARALGNREHHTIAGLRSPLCAACAQGPAFATIKVCRMGRKPGRLAQLVEHRLYTPAVTGSSPVPPIHDWVTW